MPRSVRWFERLMYLSIPVAFLALHPLVQTWQYFSQGGIIGLAVGLVVNIGLYVLLTWSIARRRKGWVRWILLVMFIFSLALAPNLSRCQYNARPPIPRRLPPRLCLSRRRRSDRPRTRY